FHSIEKVLQHKNEDGQNQSQLNDINEGRRLISPEPSIIKKLTTKPWIYVWPGVVALLALWFVINNSFNDPAEKNVTIRVFDWKKAPVTQGEVKIYLNEYIRTQSLDKLGQALFTGIPAQMLKSNRKIEVSSPGYSTRVFDTLLNNKPMELVLPLSTVVIIRGKVKTAAEQPISGVEINIEGTRYYAISITDGSYSLRVEEYTLGDEITLTTSHPGYDDKTISLRIHSPEITNQDIFLNPVSH
ncbi:MAG: carboxypeptidase regulatory-like domain-containing protein, partial [Chitinophagaceae bacterium]